MTLVMAQRACLPLTRRRTGERVHRPAWEEAEPAAQSRPLSNLTQPIRSPAARASPSSSHLRADAYGQRILWALPLDELHLAKSGLTGPWAPGRSSGPQTLAHRAYAPFHDWITALFTSSAFRTRQPLAFLFLSQIGSMNPIAVRITPRRGTVDWSAGRPRRYLSEVIQFKAVVRRRNKTSCAKPTESFLVSVCLM